MRSKETKRPRPYSHKHRGRNTSGPTGGVTTGGCDGRPLGGRHSRCRNHNARTTGQAGKWWAHPRNNTTCYNNDNHLKPNNLDIFNDKYRRRMSLTSQVLCALVSNEVKIKDRLVDRRIFVMMEVLESRNACNRSRTKRNHLCPAYIKGIVTL